MKCHFCIVIVNVIEHHQQQLKIKMNCFSLFFFFVRTVEQEHKRVEVCDVH
jgi:hypothetical protein